MNNRVFRIRIRTRQNSNQKELVQNAIKETLRQKGVVVSNATTVKEICAMANYNRSIELPICGTGKFVTNLKIQEPKI